MESDRMIVEAKASIEVKPEDVLTKEQYQQKKQPVFKIEPPFYPGKIFYEQAQQHSFTQQDFQRMAQAQQQMPNYETSWWEKIK